MRGRVAVGGGAVGGFVADITVACDVGEATAGPQETLQHRSRTRKRLLPDAFRSGGRVGGCFAGEAHALALKFRASREHVGEPADTCVCVCVGRETGDEEEMMCCYDNAEVGEYQGDSLHRSR